MKLAVLRLCKTGLVVTRRHNIVTVALISEKFVADSKQANFVAPIVSYEVGPDQTFVGVGASTYRITEFIVRNSNQIFSSV